MAELPDDLRRILAGSFAIRTTFKRKDGTPRTLETTYGWTGDAQIVLSGFPGPRDWVASLAANPEVIVHTVEGSPGFDIPGRARLLHDREARMPILLAFIDRWSMQPGFPRKRFGVLIGAVKINRRLGLPWWGPFYLARRIFDAMPCVVIDFVGEPRRRIGAAPPITAPTLPQNQKYAFHG